MSLYNDKPEIINSFITNPNTFCSAYKEDNTKKTKYIFNESSYIYNHMKAGNMENVLERINDIYNLNNIYGIGTHFSLKNDNKVYTFLNNHNGCAGCGSLNEMDDKDVFSDVIYTENFPFLAEFGVDNLDNIYDTWSYLAGYGCRTYYVMSDKMSIYVSGIMSDDTISYTPTFITKMDNIISKAGDMMYGELVILSAGKLFYINKNNNFIRSANSVDNWDLTRFDEFDDVEDFWTCGNMFIYKRDNKYFATGYCNTSEVNSIISNNTKSFAKYPFPGIQLTKAPFDEYEKIKQIIGNRFGFGVLYNDGRLFQTGLVGFTDFSMIDTEVEKIIYTNGNDITYLKDNKIKCNGQQLTEYLYRDNIYHPGIGLL